MCLTHIIYLFTITRPLGTGQIDKKVTRFQTSCYNNARWERQFESLQHFQEMYGHVNVPTISKGKFRPLGRWVSAQRKDYKKFCSNCEETGESAGARGKLFGRFQRLKNIGFQFVMGKGTYHRKFKAEISMNQTQAAKDVH